MDGRTVRYYDGIARRLRCAIERSAKPQAELAELAGVSQAHLSRFLARRATTLRGEVLQRLALELGLDPRALLEVKPARRLRPRKR